MVVSILNKIRINFSKNPWLFIVRQLYRLLIVLPYVFIVSIYYNLSNYFYKKRNLEKDSNVCFIITSVIFFKNKELSYTKTRSVFTTEERLTQTIKTIESIREKVPNAKIVLVESGFNDVSLSELEKRVDQYIYLGDKFIVRKACDSRLKSFGEAIMLLFSIPKIKNKAEYYYKVSGRNFLNDEFDINIWKKNCFSFHFEFQHKDYILTRLYGLDARYYRLWFFALLKSIPLLLINYAIEGTMIKYIPKKLINSIDVAGIQGCSATIGIDLRR